VLGKFDSRFSGLSDSDFQSFKQRMAPIAGEAYASDSRKLRDTPDKGGGIKVLVNAGGIKEVLAGKDGISQIRLFNWGSRSEDGSSSPYGAPSPVTIPAPRFSAAHGRCLHAHLGSERIRCTSYLNRAEPFKVEVELVQSGAIPHPRGSPKNSLGLCGGAAAPRTSALSIAGPPRAMCIQGRAAVLPKLYSLRDGQDDAIELLHDVPGSSSLLPLH